SGGADAMPPLRLDSFDGVAVATAVGAAAGGSAAAGASHRLSRVHHSRSLSGRTAPRTTPPPATASASLAAGAMAVGYRKILSDVAATLFCSAGKFPAGVYTSLPYHALYPGVLTFFKELVGCSLHRFRRHRAPSRALPSLRCCLPF